MFDFGDIHKVSAEQDANDILYDRLVHFINEWANDAVEIGQCRGVSVKYMETWPDAVWEPMNVMQLQKFIRTFPADMLKCNLNWIDVSHIRNMSDLFYNTHFDGDISRWNVRRVEDMSWMFHYSKFNGDISGWDVSQVEDMTGIFYGSQFNGDITGWDVSNVHEGKWMFYLSQFNQDLSDWVTNGYIKRRHAAEFGLLKYMKHV